MDQELGSRAQVVSATSFDLEHPPSSILDGEEGTFWVSTGSFPQEFIIKLSEDSDVESVVTYTTNVRSMAVDVCEESKIVQWRNGTSLDMEEGEGAVQVNTIVLNKRGVQLLRFKISSGWTDYVTVHRVSINGRAR
uniref:F5/8 type C domain-containing protein n=1 Tax=Rhizochromulina marina TaxID=1034831 RepID=A0A7S2SS73_9STRA|mmetsp:Transcript_6037/g.17632  ORF Transcript_6037/g.17632 Transcript_6037/m.17632 type:complete len:136 (+) Transcript_6037:55-462(+)